MEEIRFIQNPLEIIKKLVPNRKQRGYMEYCAPIICANYKHPVKRKDGHECTKNQNEIKSYFAENPKIIRIFF
ncbi:hypothetical protein D3C78_1205320 [compost metagenome]